MIKPIHQNKLIRIKQITPVRKNKTKMKKNKIVQSLFGLATLMLVTVTLITSCKKSKDVGEDPETGKGYSFNVWASLGAWPNETLFIANLESVEKGELDLKGKGVEATSTFKDAGLMVKNGYYYAVTEDNRFGKYKITADEIIVEQEIPMTGFSGGNGVGPTWIDDNTLYLGSANGSEGPLDYAVMDVSTMTVKASGSINIPIPTGYKEIYAGQPVYIKGKIYQGMNFVDEDWNAYPKMCIAVIDASDYTLEKIIEDDRTGALGNNWGGGRYEIYGCKDDNGDFYFGTWATAGTHDNMLLRINAGTGELDPTYVGFKDHTKQLREIKYLGNGKAIAELSDPTGIDYDKGDTYSVRYVIIELATGSMTTLTSPEGEGTVAKQLAVDADHGKAFVLLRQQNGDSHIWVYDINDGTFTQGMKLPEGYDTINRIDYMYED